MKKIAALVLSGLAGTLLYAGQAQAESHGDFRPGIDRGAGTAVLWSSCESHTFAINPGSAPRGLVREARRELTKAAEAAGLNFRYLGTTRVNPVPGPGGQVEADLILSFGELKPYVRAQFPSFYATSVRVQSPRAQDLPPEVVGLPTENIVYAGGTIPWKQLKRVDDSKRKAIVLHVIGSMLGLGVVETRAREVMSVYPQGGGEWTPGFAHGLRSLYAESGCASAPGLPEISFIDQAWGGALLQVTSYPGSSASNDDIFGFDVTIDFYGARETQRFFAPVDKLLPDGGQQARDVLGPSACSLKLTISVTPVSVSGVRGATWTGMFPQGVSPCTGS